MSIYIYIFGILFPFYTSCNGPVNTVQNDHMSNEPSSISISSDSAIVENKLSRTEEESGIFPKPSGQIEIDKPEDPAVAEGIDHDIISETSNFEHEENIEEDLIGIDSAGALVGSEELIEESLNIESIKENAKTEESIPISAPGVGEETIVPVQSIDTWQILLTKHVSSKGRVNYAEFIKDLSELNNFLAYLEKNVPGRSDSSEDAKAYWINAYNAFTIKLILDNYPIKSIRELHNGNPWDVKWVKLNDNSYSLNDIEHNILRKNWKDARIHFAVNCAAHSCPPLSNKAFTPQNTNRLLDQLSRSFINNKKFNVISSGEMSLSKIFEWYADDFGNIAEFIDSFSDVNVSKNAAISYRNYDWSLNGQ